MHLSDKILVIPGKVLDKKPYESTVEAECKHLHVTPKQIEIAVDTEHVLKQHYFDEL